MDMRTVIFSYAVSNAVCMLVMALLWRRNRRHFAGLGFWFADFGLQLAAVLLAPLRGILPDILSIVAANACAIGGTIFLLVGLEQFVGKRTSQISNSILWGIFVSVHSYFTFVQPNLLIREINFSLAIIVVHAQGVWLMFRKVEPGMRSTTRGVGYLFLAVCLAALARIVINLVVTPGSDFFKSTLYDALYIMSDQMLFIILTFSLFLMVNSRVFSELENDIEKHKEMQEILYKSARRYQSLFDNMLEGFAYCKMIYVDGKPQDFIYLEVNDAFEKLTGLNDVRGKKVSEVIPGVRESDSKFFDAYSRVASTGESEQFDTYSDDLKSWFLVSLYSTEPGYFVVIFENITERKKIEKALQISQKLAEELYESTPDALITVNVAGKITRVNDQTQAMFGYARDELLDQTIEMLIPQRVHAIHEHNRSEFFRQPRVREMGSGIELSALKKDGSEFPVEIELSPLRIGDETFVTADIRDITERRRIDQALRYRTEVLAALHQVTLDMVNRHDVDDILQTLLVNIGDLLRASDVSFDLVEDDSLITYAATSGQPLGKGDVMHRGEGGWLSWEAVDSGRTAVLEDYAEWPKRRTLFDGYPIHAIMIIPVHQRDRVIGAINISRHEANQPFGDSDVFVGEQLAQMAALVLDNAQLYAQLNSDLAERIKSETALREMQTQLVEQQRELATIDERQRMARDLHDSVNQSIHSLVLFSETLVHMLDKNNVERARQISQRLEESARQAIKETRLLLYQTQISGEQSGMNLLEELNSRLSNVELRAGVRAQVNLEGLLSNCPEAWYKNLFWITIEALNNSLKHAQARSVEIFIRSFPKYIEIEVKDNGRGFDAAKPNTGGYGLRNMRERAELLGGVVTVKSNPAKGTSVLFRAEIKE